MNQRRDEEFSLPGFSITGETAQPLLKGQTRGGVSQEAANKRI